MTRCTITLQDTLPFSNKDLRQSGVERFVGSISSITPVAIKERYYSIAGIVNVTNEAGHEQAVFFKKHRPNPDAQENNTSETQCKRKRNLKALRSFHLREYSFLEEISKRNSSLVPRLFGRVTTLDEENLLLFMEVLEGAPAKDVYESLAKSTYEAVKSGDHSKKEHLFHRKLEQLLEDFKKIARFAGICQSQKSHFSKSEWIKDGYQSIQKDFPSRLTYYLLRTVYYNDLRENLNEFDREATLKHIQDTKGINFQEEINEIIKLRESNVCEYWLQHGDCRKEHNFSGRFCDLEDFGLYPWYHDTVTYTGDENTAPPVSQLPYLLAYYLLYAQAYKSKSPEAMLTKLNSMGKVKEKDTVKEKRLLLKLIENNVGKERFANFVCGYVAGSIEEDVIINGIRKKYSSKHISQLVERYPGHTAVSLQTSRMEHVTSIYTFMTSIEAGPLLEKCSEPEAVAMYFYKMGNLLKKLGLVRIDRLEYLKKRGSSSQYGLFLGGD